MEKKKISWITPDSFLDTDLPVVKALSDVYEITWIITIAHGKSQDDENFVRMQLKECKVDLSFYYFQSRIRSPKHFFEVLNLIKRLKRTNAELYYLSESFLPFGVILYKHLLPLKKCIVPCHNVTTPKGARKAWFASYYTHKWLNTFTNIQTFSKCQCEELKARYKGKNVLMTYFILKDYGQPTKEIRKENLSYVRFLIFGNIIRYKRIDLLIAAAEELYNKGIRNFKVRIAGNCKNWAEEYAPLIKHPEIFELEIKRIPNEEVANLFVDSHYFVMPYQDIAQSGSMSVAFRYNLPTIVTDIPQFKEFVKDGETGYVFKTQDSHALAEKMAWIIENHESIYPSLCSNQRQFVTDNMSLEAITKKYITYFDKL